MIQQNEYKNRIENMQTIPIEKEYNAKDEEMTPL